MKTQKLANAIASLGTNLVTIDWGWNSVVISGKKLAEKGEYTIALPAIGATQTQVFQITVNFHEILAALEKLNPSNCPYSEVKLQVIEKKENVQNAPVQFLQIEENLSEDDSDVEDDEYSGNYAREFYEIRAIVTQLEQFKVFYLDRQQLQRLVQKDCLEQDGYVLKATKKIAEVTTKVTKKHGTVKVLNIPQGDIELALSKDWELSVCLMEGDLLRIVHRNGELIAFDKKVQTSIPTIATINFTSEEWKKMRFATKVVASLPCRSQSDHVLTGIEVHTGSYTRIKGFSGISVYSAELGRSDKPGRFLVPQSGIDEFCRIQSDDDKVVSLYFKENGEFVLTSESAALRGELMDVNEYPSDWHELPISREVPAEFNRDEFIKALSETTRWLNWRNPTDNYCRIWWEDNALTFQGIDGLVKLTPKNKGYDTTPHKCYVSAVALAEIIEHLDSRFRIALPTSDTEMCRISDDKTEAGICVLYEPHFISFRKEQQALPDALVQEVLDTNGAFECRAIEVNPIAQAEPIPEPGAIEEEAEELLEQVAEFVRSHRSHETYSLFPVDMCPIAATVRTAYRLATPEGFAEIKKQYKSSQRFADFAYGVIDIIKQLDKSSDSVQELLSQEEIAKAGMENLRIQWQISLNREYARGYNAALRDVSHEAKLQGIEGIEEICEKLRSELPDDLPKLGDRLTVWVGRMLTEEQKLAPITQVEFRPQ